MKRQFEVLLYGISIYSLDSLKQQLLTKFKMRSHDLSDFEARLRIRLSKRRKEDTLVIWNSLSDSLTGIKGDMEGPKNDFIQVEGSPMLSDAVNGWKKDSKPENEALTLKANARLNELKNFIEALDLFEIVYK